MLCSISILHACNAYNSQKYSLTDQYNAQAKSVWDEENGQSLWAFPITLHASFANRSFDHHSQSAPLSTFIFQKNFTLSDISLFIALCKENKVRDYNGPPLPPDRIPAQAGSMNPPFGSFANDEYTTLLAPTKVIIDAEQREIGASFTFLRQIVCDCFPSLKPVIGLTVPVISRLHIMDLKLTGGSLFRDVFIQNPTNREDSAKPFFRNFTDVYDFFDRGILGPKGLTFDARQRRTGFGDITLFGFVEIVDPVCNLANLQMGVNLVCPSGGRQDPTIVWSPVLGNGGGYELDLSVQGAFDGCTQWFNLIFRAIAQIGLPFKNQTRLPQLQQLANGPEIVNIVPALLAPPPFGTYYVDSYVQYDTTVPYFSDSEISVKTRIGPRFSFMIGNLIEQPACINCRLGIFYEYMYKLKDTVNPSGECCDTKPHINPRVATGRSQQHEHRISWNLAHEFTKQLELSFGSYHVVAGKNVAREQRIFLSGLFHF